MKRDGLKYLTRREKQALVEYLTRLREQFGDQVQRVILYGSKVRGDFDADTTDFTQAKARQVLEDAARFVARMEKHLREVGAIE